MTPDPIIFRVASSNKFGSPPPPRTQNAINSESRDQPIHKAAKLRVSAAETAAAGGLNCSRLIYTSYHVYHGSPQQRGQMILVTTGHSVWYSAAIEETHSTGPEQRQLCLFVQGRTCRKGMLLTIQYVGRCTHRAVQETQINGARLCIYPVNVTRKPCHLLGGVGVASTIFSRCASLLNPISSTDECGLPSGPVTGTSRLERLDRSSNSESRLASPYLTQPFS